MNLKDVFTESRPLQIKWMFASNESVTSIQLLASAQLKEHTAHVPAFLVCVTGEVFFENEKGVREVLLSGDFINIEPAVKLCLSAESDSLLLLIN